MSSPERCFRDFQSSEFVWVHDPRKWRYVRENTYCDKRQLRDVQKDWFLVGYEVLAKPKEWSVRQRNARYWWLKDYDVGMPKAAECYVEGGSPCEAVVFV